MKIDDSLLVIPELKKIFSSREAVQKSELRDFYYLHHPDLNEQAFRRIMYSLEKEKVIIPLGAGVYGLQTQFQTFGRRYFIPQLSTIALEISHEVTHLFPYTSYMIWETHVLHEFMIHQPGANQIIIGVDKEAANSVFNKLNENRSLNVYLKPDKFIMDRYIATNPDSVLILPLITQSPRMKVHGVVYARLEKILVDIFSEEERFFIFHGQEMINIFENAFASYWINAKTLFRYAGRRKVDVKIKKFIKTQTQIILPSL
ncbi:MAG: hypothetical protein CVU41_17355 [Chloroflexi bacterium HGW-Chloroflexi-3]|nr:MAG: hypothetical protein CVU41_17355 [Chloroflexi bacterium HGW-Chloroflexi-3]